MEDLFRRELVGTEIEGIEIDDVGNFVIPSYMYPAVEQVFGKQVPVYVAPSYVVLEQIKTSRFFYIQVHSGVVIGSHNVKIDDADEYWTADTPDLYELSSDVEGEPDPMVQKIRHMFVSLIRGSFPVDIVRYTYVRNTAPKSGVSLECCHVRPGMKVQQILSGKIRGSYYIDGYVTMYIRPVLA